jgi:hypothetical protein
MRWRIAQWLLEPGAEHSSHTLFGWVKTLGILPPLIVLSPMTLTGTKLNMHLLYLIQCMMNAGRNSFLVDTCYMFRQYFAPKGEWQDLHDDDKTCMQSSYWELILENGQYIAYLGTEKGGVTPSICRSTSVSHTTRNLRHVCRRFSIIDQCLSVTPPGICGIRAADFWS